MGTGNKTQIIVIIVVVIIIMALNKIYMSVCTLYRPTFLPVTTDSDSVFGLHKAQRF